MRFFASISIAALCFVASIQAAPAGVGAPGLDQATGAVNGVAGKVPVVGPVIQKATGGAPAGGANGVPGATPGNQGGVGNGIPGADAVMGALGG
ncbi:hypothetical protein O0I10_008387 [Lichtheimia ornata]|uniref:Uncharacterized protein n=1 Tax=Lichtheimia ornata TaxID=688661 RepID=A0AAD7UYS6_9FUNG|nr:uncharacterized protein O0I10_008387 [Lichtheimia ornata]KAJ8655947.1 hypothetical protein O0I10_008387 [Lichtheimia ornata]